MQLFYTRSSPYANCVRMTITALGIGDVVEMIESHPFENKEEFIHANPLGKVPCLVDNGEAIIDSEVICDYLDANTTGGQLFNPVYADWRLKTLYSVCYGMIDACVARRIEVLREKDGLKSAFWWQRQNQAIVRTLDYLAEKIDLLPKELCILHIAYMVCLGYLDFRHPDIDWRQTHAKLAVWFNEFSNEEWFRNNPFVD